VIWPPWPGQEGNRSCSYTDQAGERDVRAGGLRVAELTLSLGQTDSSCRPAGKKRCCLQHGAAHPATRRDVIDYVATGGGLDFTLLFIKHNLALINFKC